MECIQSSLREVNWTNLLPIIVLWNSMKSISLAWQDFLRFLFQNLLWNISSLKIKKRNHFISLDFNIHMYLLIRPRTCRWLFLSFSLHENETTIFSWFFIFGFTLQCIVNVFCLFHNFVFPFQLKCLQHYFIHKIKKRTFFITNVIVIRVIKKMVSSIHDLKVYN